MRISRLLLVGVGTWCWGWFPLSAPRISFSISGNADHLYVMPSDAAPLMASGRVDDRLFDVTTLLANGYNDTVPVIATHLASRSVLGARITRDLPAVNGVAMVARQGNAAWESLTASAGKVWLDGKRQSAVDRSVPQIVAPTAWEAGYTDAGVKVAVLDTGVDQTHLRGPPAVR